jgi:hypothetical protein
MAVYKIDLHVSMLDPPHFSLKVTIVGQRDNGLIWVDILGKWSLIDAYVIMVLMMVAFNFTLEIAAGLKVIVRWKRDIFKTAHTRKPVSWCHLTSLSYHDSSPSQTNERIQDIPHEENGSRWEGKGWNGYLRFSSKPSQMSKSQELRLSAFVRVDDTRRAEQITSEMILHLRQVP